MMTPPIPPNYLVTLDIMPAITVHSHQQKADFDMTVAIGIKTKEAKVDVYVDLPLGKSYSNTSREFRELGIGIEATIVNKNGTDVHAFIEPWDINALGDPIVAFGGSAAKEVYKGIKLGIELDRYADDNRMMAIGSKALGHFDLSGGLGISNLASHSDADQSESRYKPFITETVAYSINTLISISIEGKHWIGRSADEMKAGVLLSF